MRRLGLFLLIWLSFFWAGGYAGAPYRVEKSFEDTVRIAVIYNHTVIGHDEYTPFSVRPVGEKTKNIVVESLEPLPSDNLKVLKSQETDWGDINNLWGGELPHAVVHVQAGWYDQSGPYIERILNKAAERNIGILSVGDDACFIARDVFGFEEPDNVPAPMYRATQYDQPEDRLWILLDRQADTLRYNGVIRRTRDSILDSNKLYFKPYRELGRGEQDADKYIIRESYKDNISLLGFQQAWDESLGLIIGGNRRFPVIAVFQDGKRRAVAF